MNQNQNRTRSLNGTKQQLLNGYFLNNNNNKDDSAGAKYPIPYLNLQSSFREILMLEKALNSKI